MNQSALEEIVSSKARLRIADLLSVRPRTLRELADLTGISMPGVLKHLARMEKLGLVAEAKVEGGAFPVRKVYSMKGVRIGDFSHGNLTVVKVTDSTVKSAKSEDAVKELESLAADALVQKRRIRDQTRRLGRMIDELVNTESRIGGLIGGLGAEDEDRLLLHTAFTEESMEEAERSLTEHYGMREPKRALDKAVSRARKLGKK
jgi:predicted transcriptional regulator